MTRKDPIEDFNSRANLLLGIEEAIATAFRPNTSPSTSTTPLIDEPCSVRALLAKSTVDIEERRAGRLSG